MWDIGGGARAVLRLAVRAVHRACASCSLTSGTSAANGATSITCFELNQKGPHFQRGSTSSAPSARAMHTAHRRAPSCSLSESPADAQWTTSIDGGQVSQVCTHYRTTKPSEEDVHDTTQKCLVKQSVPPITPEWRQRAGRGALGFDARASAKIGCGRQKTSAAEGGPAAWPCRERGLLPLLGLISRGRAASRACDLAVRGVL